MRPAVMARSLGVSLLLYAVWLAVAPASAQTPDEIRQIRIICSSPELQTRIREQAAKTDRLADVELELEERCAQVDLPSAPVHAPADASPEASHADWAYDARYSPDGRTVVSASRDGTLRVWDAETGKPIRRIVVAEADRLKRQEGIVRSVAVVGDGTRVAAASDGNPVRLMDVATGTIIGSFPITGGCCGSTIAATTGGLLFIGGHSEAVEAVDVNTHTTRYRLPGHQKEASAIAVSETADLVATGASSRYSEPKQSPRVHLWRLSNGEKIAEFEPQDGDRPVKLTFSRDGALLAVFMANTVHVYSVAERRSIRTIGPTSASFDAAFTADGKGLITCGRHPVLWDLATGKKLRHFGPFSDLCHSVDVSPDGRFALTTSTKTDLRVWEIATGTFHRRIGGVITPRR